MHPFLFTAFPILFLFAHNRAWFTRYDEVVILLATALGATAVLLFLLTAALRSSTKAGIITSLFVLLFFSYGHLYEWAFAHGADVFLLDRHRYLLPTFGILFALGSYVVVRTRRDLRNLAGALQLGSLALVAVVLLNLGLYELGPGAEPRKEKENAHPITANNETATESPDIYYIILDSYASSQTLKDFYGYDNSEFTNYLEEKSFYIASKSLSNYDGTERSLPSSLNMEYLDDNLIASGNIRPEDVTALIRNNEVLRFLKSKGYTTVNIGHWWEPTSYNEYADLNFQGGRYGSEFVTLLVRTTALAPFVQNFLASDARTEVLNMFEILTSVPRSVEGPKFVFVHFLSPHNPFIFGRNGEPVDPHSLDDGGEKAAYLNQLMFINKKIMETVDALLAQSDTPPIIVIQSDHGVGEAVFRNFSAYHLPHGGNRLLYESITPVNSFRLIFNYYFDAEYEMLPDRAYATRPITEEADAYTFVDVTDTVIYD